MIPSPMIADPEEILKVRPPSERVSDPLIHQNPLVLPFYLLGPLKMTASIECKPDGRWYHVSYSMKKGSRTPTHFHTCLVRKHMFRPTSVIVAVFPPVEEYVDEHKSCLHLWERLDGPRVIPDLREVDITGRKTI